MQRLANIFCININEFRTFWREAILLLLVIHSFRPGMYMDSSGAGDMPNNASVTFVDEDHSTLSRALQTALFPPRFLQPREAIADQFDRLPDWGETTSVVVISAGFEGNVHAGRTPSLQNNIDAIKLSAAAVGTG